MQHFGRLTNTFLHLILICRADFIFLQTNQGIQRFKIQNSKIVVIELLIVWIVGVVAFFMLWAVLTKVIKRISEKKGQDKDAVQEKVTEKEPSAKSEI